MATQATTHVPRILLAVLCGVASTGHAQVQPPAITPDHVLGPDAGPIVDRLLQRSPCGGEFSVSIHPTDIAARGPCALDVVHESAGGAGRVCGDQRLHSADCPVACVDAVCTALTPAGSLPWRTLAAPPAPNATSTRTYDADQRSLWLHALTAVVPALLALWGLWRWWTQRRPWKPEGLAMLATVALMVGSLAWRAWQGGISGGNEEANFRVGVVGLFSGFRLSDYIHPPLWHWWAQAWMAPVLLVQAGSTDAAAMGQAVVENLEFLLLAGQLAALALAIPLLVAVARLTPKSASAWSPVVAVALLASTAQFGLYAAQYSGYLLGMTGLAWLLVLAAERGPSPPDRWTPWLAGLLLGIALGGNGWAALGVVLLPVACRGNSWRQTLGRTLVAGSVAAMVVLVGLLPMESADLERLRGVLHFRLHSVDMAEKHAPPALLSQAYLPELRRHWWIPVGAALALVHDLLRWKARPPRLLWAWVALWTVVLTAVQTRAPGYLLFVLPAACVLTARGWAVALGGVAALAAVTNPMKLARFQAIAAVALVAALILPLATRAGTLDPPTSTHPLDALRAWVSTHVRPGGDVVVMTEGTTLQAERAGSLLSEELLNALSVAARRRLNAVASGTAGNQPERQWRWLASRDGRPPEGVVWPLQPSPDAFVQVGTCCALDPALCGHGQPVWCARPWRVPN